MLKSQFNQCFALWIELPMFGQFVSAGSDMLYGWHFELHVVLKGTRRIAWAVKCTRPLLLDRSLNMTLLQWINVLTEVINLDNIPKLPCTKAAWCGTPLLFLAEISFSRLYFRSAVASEPLSLLNLFLVLLWS